MEAFEEAWKVEGLCLPTLLTLGVYAVTFCEPDHGPRWGGPGSPVAYEQGSHCLLHSIGRLVSAGAFTSLEQVCLKHSLWLLVV